MSKHIITTVQTVINKYYVEVDDPEWACDAIVCKELEPFSYTHSMESIIEVKTLKKNKRWPMAKKMDMNAATYKCVYSNEEHTEFGVWFQDVRWDLGY